MGRDAPAAVVGVVILVAVITCLAGCATVDWKGRSIDEVIQALGNPSNIKDLPDGRRVYTWVTHGSVPVAPVFGPKGEVVRPPGNLPWVKRRVFVVDPDGVVLQVRDIQPPPPTPQPIPGYPGS